MKKIILVLFVFGFMIQSFAQVITLPEVEVLARNYKYLDDVNLPGVGSAVEALQRYATEFDLKNSEYYEDEYEKYFISFFIPDGKILAAYDKDGNILRTVEKYKNMKLPIEVAQSITKNYSGWTIAENVYLVNYHDNRGVMKKEFKILLERGNRRMRVKTDERGNIL
ncbi:nicotinate-nucleotide adenylyltransferase [Rhodonellum sp.]|uniref:nicotinate-nucleotide adenylyltransferase n=1 Tax=Rhodonellum sp. TaxID=2231180 RepID=UPI002728AF0F|nr:nicotinate-nucleotide adenylyltransferase [Rhodonellum sp.]MDO9551928.1 nicotinate-nucleotide adenylyltransferase [Rhodonellum sp.]